MSRRPNKEKRQEILEYLKTVIADKGYPPSIREIGDAVNLKSTSTVYSHLDRMEKEGMIRRGTGKTRAIEIVDGGFSEARRSLIQIPVIGTVAAGEPILAKENIEEYFPYPADRLPTDQNLFMLRVKDNSMKDMGILSGDLVICQETSKAKNGDIVVVLINEEATVKRFYKERKRYRLQPENASMEPIITDHVQIIGKVISLYRDEIS